MSIEVYGRACDAGCCVKTRDTELDPWDHAYAQGRDSINFIRPMFEVEPDHGGRAYYYAANLDEIDVRLETGEEPVYL